MGINYFKSSLSVTTLYRFIYAINYKVVNCWPSLPAVKVILLAMEKRGHQ